MRIVPYRSKQAEPKRRPLDKSQIVRAALALMDEAGMDELTMRRLGERLGVKAASLYRHVRDKDELLVLIADEICGEIPTAKAAGSWREQMMETAWNVRRGLHAHRDAARLLAATPPFGPRRLRLIESVLRILVDAGFSSRDAARAAYHCNNFVTEFAADEARFAEIASSPRFSRKKLSEETRRQFRALPADEFPTLVALADDLSENDADGLFQFGLEVWLQGLEKVARPGR